MIRRTIAGALTGIVAGLVAIPAGAPAATPASSHLSPPARAAWMRTPCAEEDSVNCYWNAREMGNGHGHSFYVRRMPGDVTGLVCYFYVGKRFARHHDHCEPVR